jgi:hypothetical protein
MPATKSETVGQGMKNLLTDLGSRFLWDELVASPRVELGTHGFSVRCSTS